MRICFIIEAGAAGAGNVVLDLARKLVEAGDDITVIYGTSRTWSSFVKTLTLLGIRTIGCPMRREVGIHDVLDAYVLYRALRRIGPIDVVHAHSSKAGALVRLLRLFFLKSVFIYTPHAFVTMAVGTPAFYGEIERVLSQFCNMLICVSNCEKRHAIEKLRIPEHKLCVIPNGIDLTFCADRARSRQQMGMTDRDFVVGFVGRFEPQKNPLRAVEAFSEAAARNDALRLVMIGYGAMQEDIERRRLGRGLTGRMSIIQDTNARELISGFDLLLCSSDYESYGLVIVEALAMGVSVVTTPVGIAEDVISTTIGVKTNDFSVHALMAGILDVSGWDAARRAEAYTAAKGCAKQFDLTTTARNTRTLYNLLQARRHAGFALRYLSSTFDRLEKINKWMVWLPIIIVLPFFWGYAMLVQPNPPESDYS